MTTPKALREMCERILKPGYFHFRDPAHLPQRADEIRSVARAHIALLDRLSGEAVTREKIIERLMSCDGPAVMQPSMQGYEERLARWERGRREMAEKRADAILSLLPAGMDRNAVIEECEKCVPTNWLDSLLTGPDGLKGKCDNREIEKLLRGVQDRIRALKSS